MKVFLIDFYYLGLERCAEVSRHTDQFPLHYTITFDSFTSILMDLEKMEITFPNPIPIQFGAFMTPMPKVKYDNSVFNDIEFENLILKAIRNKDGNEYII